MIFNPIVVANASMEMANCSMTNETRFTSDTFYFLNDKFQVESVSVSGYGSRNISVPVGTLFCYYYMPGAISTEFSGNVQNLNNGIYKVTGDFLIRIYQ